MAKETCRSCEVRLDGPAPFCKACGQPTRFASDAERIDWDLNQWRAHVDRSVAAGVVPNGSVSARANGTLGDAATAVATRPRPEQELRFDPPTPAAVRVETKEPVTQKREKRSRRIHIPKPRLRRGPSEPQRVVELDRDHEFAYRACTTCEATDWIVRTTRNAEETWNYWCVRCSRSFKTEVKIRNALKPFLSAGIVIGGLMTASTLMLR